MISSVIARLTPKSVGAEQLVEQLIVDVSNRDGLEVGELVDGRLLPITIDAANAGEMELSTRWLQERVEVEFVDVVFVHFEEEDSTV